MIAGVLRSMCLCVEVCLCVVVPGMQRQRHTMSAKATLVCTPGESIKDASLSRRAGGTGALLAISLTTPCMSAWRRFDTCVQDTNSCWNLSICTCAVHVRLCSGPAVSILHRVCPGPFLISLHQARSWPVLTVKGRARIFLLHVPEWECLREN